MRLDRRRVLITGHTGFKGGWLSFYARHLGAEIGGYSLGRTTGPSFYEAAGLRRFLAYERRADVTDPVALREALRAFQPDVVFHLAARAIVRDGLDDPFGTVRTNVLGTTAVLDAVRRSPGVEATVIVTTDKVYRNVAVPCGENDPLGGRSPYGASKAAAEMVVGGYRQAFDLNVATARSGNVVGGGDWGRERLIPNCLRAWRCGEPVTVYRATRPFLHVADTCRGYLMLAANMLNGATPDAMNFGPRESHDVDAVARYLAARMGGVVRDVGAPPPREAATLRLDTARARTVLGWSPRWPLHEALDRTADWHKAHDAGSDMELVTLDQIEAHAGRSDWRAA